MGLLDDAIREHLDLKRRRGADPAEVARAEQEALGPVRRDSASAHGEDDHAEHATIETHHDPEPAAHDEPAHEPHDPEHDPRAHVVDPRHSDLVHQPTTEFHVEDHEHEDGDDDPVSHAAHGVEAEADEDVLEETPDFLQETPEHDRLWFEQRPPRDFDFDG